MLKKLSVLREMANISCLLIGWKCDAMAQVSTVLACLDLGVSQLKVTIAWRPPVPSTFVILSHPPSYHPHSHRSPPWSHHRLQTRREVHRHRHYSLLVRDNHGNFALSLNRSLYQFCFILQTLPWRHIFHVAYLEAA